MNRKILFVVLTLAVVLLATPYIGMVHAAPPTDVLFYVPLETFGLTADEFIQAGKNDNWIEHDSTYGTYAGDIVGTWTADAFWIYHNWVGPYQDPYLLTVEKSNGFSLQTIDVTAVLGMEKTGTIYLRFNDVFGVGFEGTWVIYGGTGELKGVHGQGTWAMNFVSLRQVFEGQIVFDS